MSAQRYLTLIALTALLAACASSPADAPADLGGNDTGFDGGDGGRTNPGGNEAPSLFRVGDKRAVVDRSLIIELRASDPDGDELDFSVFGDLPDGAKFDKETARFNWTPTSDDLGSQWLITFQVSDGVENDRETITITVAASLDNSAPSFVDPGDQLLPINEPYELSLEATDPDGDVLTFSIVGTSPETSTFDTTVGRFAWTPSADTEDSTHRVLFEVTDGTESDDLFVNFRVGSASVVFPAIEPLSVRLGETLSHTLFVENPAGQAYSCGALGTLPAGASFDDGACRFAWSPTDAALINTTIQIPFEINDGELTLVQTASITVLPADTGACEEDAFEADEAGGFAAPIEPGSYAGLTLCGEDDDWFDIDLEEGQEIEVHITFEHDTVDIDLALWAPGSDSEPFRVSEGVTDSETIRVESVPEAGSWQIEIYGLSPGDTTYDLSVTVSEIASCLDDDHEENDFRASATAIEIDDTVAAQWCLGDVDWYEFEAQSGDELTVEIISDNGLDLDVAVYEPDETSASWWGLEGGDTETLVVPSLPVGGTFALEVFSVEEADSAYALSVSLAGCDDDDLEEGAGNDTPDNARELVDDVAVTGRVFCDPDYYFVILEAGDEADFYLDYDTEAYATPTVVFHRIDLDESLGDITTDSFGLGVYLESAPSEDIYILGIVAADPGLVYDVIFYDYSAE